LDDANLCLKVGPSEMAAHQALKLSLSTLEREGPYETYDGEHGKDFGGMPSFSLQSTRTEIRIISPALVTTRRRKHADEMEGQCGVNA
jgi:hypothetical protein